MREWAPADRRGRLALPPGRSQRLVRNICVHCKRPAKVSRAQLEEKLYGWKDDISSNAVEVYVYRLRKRLEGTGAAIQTIRGFGYLLDVESAA